MAPPKKKAAAKKQIAPPSKTLLDCSFKQISAPRRFMPAPAPEEYRYYDPNPYYIKNGGLALRFTDDTGKAVFIPSTGCDAIDKYGNWMGPG